MQIWNKIQKFVKKIFFRERILSKILINTNRIIRILTKKLNLIINQIICNWAIDKSREKKIS